MMSPLWKTLHYQVDQGIALLRLSRPEALNAINHQMLAEISSVLDLLDKDPKVRVLILTGEGKAFAAGADIARIQQLSEEEARAFCLEGQSLFNRIEDLDIPVIAAVNGYALGGGCELALACDIRLASTTAKFGLPELGLGIIPGYGGTQRLPRMIGIGPALYYLFTGESINAQEALRLGLVQGAFPVENLLNQALELARRISAKAPLALALAKRSVREGLDLPLKQGIAMEAQGYLQTFLTKDRVEGMAAFLEKRKPQFQEERWQEG